jgi:TolB-like protein/tetratricopeptide (TPR) repeat protein
MVEWLERLKGSLADRYDFDRELTGGGMSRVFVAHERSLGRSVVVKILPPELAGSVNLERFRREMQVAARLQHSHIVPVLTAGEADGQLYYTMPYVEGESLRERIARTGALPDAEVIRMLSDVLGALAYAHSRGIVHRDIKPENILLSEGGALLADFGIAKAMETAGRTTLTGTGMMVGTPAYTAPEQAAGDPNMDHRADLYAVGAVAYEMLTGEQLYHGRSPHLQMAAHIVEAPPDLAVKRPELPERLTTLVMRCLEKDPAKRPQSARDVLQEVQTIGRVSGVIPRAPGRRRPVLIGLGIAAMVLVVAGWIFIPRDVVASLRTLARRKPAQHHVNRVVVAPFDNETGDPKLNAIGSLVADWIADGLSHLPSLEVVDARSAAAAGDVVQAIPRLLRRNDNGALADETGSGVVIAGTIYRDSTPREGAVIRFQARVIDATTNRVRQVLPMISGPAADVRPVVEALRRQLVAGMRAVSDTGLSSMPGAYTSPPTLEAYDLTRKALEAYFRNDTSVWTLLARARAVDSSYATPVVFTAFAAGYRRRFALADSALARLDKMRDRLTPAELAMTDHIHALMRADVDSALKAAQTFVKLQPGSMEAPLLLASFAISARKPRTALDALKLVDPDRGLNLAGPFYWLYMASASSELGNPREALGYLEEASRRFPTSTTVRAAQAVELVRLGRGEEAEHMVQSVYRRRPGVRIRMQSLIAHLYDQIDRPDDAERLVTTSLAELAATRDTSRARMMSRYDLLSASNRHWQDLLAVTDSLLPRVQTGETGFRLDLLSTKAVALIHVGRVADAMHIDSLLAGPRPPYHYGWASYGRARIAANRGKPDDAMKFLRQAEAEGLTAISLVPPYAADPLLAPLHRVAEFKAMVSNLP